MKKKKHGLCFLFNQAPQVGKGLLVSEVQTSKVCTSESWVFKTEGCFPQALLSDFPWLLMTARCWFFGVTLRTCMGFCGHVEGSPNYAYVFSVPWDDQSFYHKLPVIAYSSSLRWQGWESRTSSEQLRSVLTVLCSSLHSCLVCCCHQGAVPSSSTGAKPNIGRWWRNGELQSLHSRLSHPSSMLSSTCPFSHTVCPWNSLGSLDAWKLGGAFPGRTPLSRAS